MSKAKSETYAVARKRLHAALALEGWTVSSPALKEPWAKSPFGGFRITFHPQAVYLNGHSLFLDMRGLSLDALLSAVRGRS